MMPNIDIEPKQMKILLSLLKNFLPNTTAWAYGSRAKWTSRPSSDLDMVVFTSPEQKSQVFALQEAFEGSDLPFRVDLFVWDEVPEEFKEGIKEQHVVLTAPVSGSPPDGWVSKQIGEIMPFTYGKSLASRDRASSGAVPVYGSNGVVGFHDKAITHGPTVIIGRKGTAGAVHFSSGPCWPIDTTFYIEGKDRELVRFQYYALQSLGLEGMNTDSAVPGLNRTAVHARQIIVPVSARERQSIAEVLGALDDKIELNRRTNGTLEAMARALFKSWFVDFDPVHAKAALRNKANHSPQGGSDESAGGWTVAQARAYLDQMSPEIMALFPDRLDDDGKPVGWRAGTIDDCFRLIMGQSPPGNTYNDGEDGLPFFQGRTDFGFRYPANRKYCSAPTRVAVCDDTLVSVRAPVGDINMAWEESCIGRGVAALRHRSGSRSFTYYSAWAMQQELRQYEHTGTVFGAITKKQFGALKTLEPTSEAVSLFEEQVGPLDEQIRRNEAEIRTLVQTRDLLLPQLISGKVRVLGD